MKRTITGVYLPQKTDRPEIEKFCENFKKLDILIKVLFSVAILKLAKAVIGNKSNSRGNI